MVVIVLGDRERTLFASLEEAEHLFIAHRVRDVRAEVFDIRLRVMLFGVLDFVRERILVRFNRFFARDFGEDEPHLGAFVGRLLPLGAQLFACFLRLG